MDFNARLYDLPPATHPFGWGPANSVASSLAHWDSVWYLLIANKTYVGPNAVPSPMGSGLWDASVNFFPGYPMIVRLVSGGAASPAVVLVAAYVISLVAFVTAVYLLYRLAELEAGPQTALWCAVSFALFPGALFFATPYAESMFVALCVGCLYAGRTGRWRLACALGAAASLTRPPGILLVIPLALLYLYGPSGRGARRAARADAAWILVLPLALVAWFAYCWNLTGDPLAYFHIGERFGRGLSDPVSAVAAAFRAGSHALANFVFGPEQYPADAAYRYADLSGLLAFAAAVLLTVGAFRHLPRPYGWFCAVSLLVILCTGPPDHPLLPGMRYIAVVFPLFIELGRLLAGRVRVAWATAVCMAVGLALVTSAYARWAFLG